MSQTTMPSPAAGAPGPTTHRSRPVPLVLGIVLALLGLPALLGGLALGWALGTGRDADGFFSTPTHRYSTSSVALTSGALELGTAAPADWGADRALATVRLTATSRGAPVFLGVGRTADVERYLAGASYDEVGDLRAPGRATTTRHGSGSTLPGSPTDQSFWVARADGTGTRTLTWDVTPGTYTAVVMNADGSPGVTVDLVAAGRVGLLVPAAWALGLAGAVLVVGGALLVAYGGAGGTSGGAPGPVPRSGLLAGAAGTVPSPVTVSGHQDPRLSRWLWLVKWVLAVPHFVVLALLWLVFVALTLVAFVAILVTGRYPRGLFDVDVGILRWTWRVQFYATSVLGTDRYPPFTLDRSDYPAELDVAYPERLSRGLVLVKSWLLAIPHLIVLSVLAGTWRVGDTDGLHVFVGGLVGALALAAGLLLLFGGRYPTPLFDLLVGLNRWAYRVIAYVALMTDVYPPFRLDQGPTEPTPGAPVPDQPGASVSGGAPRSTS